MVSISLVVGKTEDDSGVNSVEERTELCVTSVDIVISKFVEELIGLFDVISSFVCVESDVDVCIISSG